MKLSKKITNILLTAILTATLTITPACSLTQQNNTGNQQTTQQAASTTYTSKDDALNALNTITIAEAKDVDYNRKENFGEWAYVSSEKHNTRFEVLKNQADDVKIDNNKIVGGTWTIKYNGETVTYNTKDEVSKQLQIDHLLPISYAYRHGADEWTQDKREEFANDYGQDTQFTVGTNGQNDYKHVGNLVVSDTHSNTSKSDKGPSEWMPSNKAYQVEYCYKWIQLCTNYGVSITQADYNTIKNTIS